MQVISTGLGPLIVPVRDEAALRRAERIESACRRATERSGGECLYLFAVRGDGDVMARMFDATLGVGEDPATAPSGRSACTSRRAGSRACPATRWSRKASWSAAELPAPGRPRGRGPVAGPRGAAFGSSARGASGWPTRTLGRSGWVARRIRVALVDLHGQHLGDPGSKGAELTYAAVSFRNVARPTSTGTLQRTCDGSLPRFVTLKLKQAGVPHPPGSRSPRARRHRTAEAGRSGVGARPGSRTRRSRSGAGSTTRSSRRSANPFASA